MSAQGELIAVNESLAAKRAVLSQMLRGVDSLSGQKAAARAESIKTLNSDLAGLIEKQYELQERADFDRAQHDALKTMRQPVDRQIMPSDDDATFGEPDALKRSSWGEAVVQANSEGYRGYKALLTTGSVPVTIPLNPDPVRSPVRPRFLRELIPSTGNETGSYSYLQQTTRTNNAAPVAEGALKPTSIYTMERIDDTVRTIAHLSEPIPRQQLDDAPLLRQFVDNELRLGLFLALDDQLLNGNGTAPNLRGLNNVSGIQTVTTGADALTRVRTAITRLQQEDLEPDALVVSPGDWAKIESTAMAQYAANPNMTPLDAMSRRVFGVTVLVTNAVANGTGWLGAFRDGSFLVIREEARVDWTEAGYSAGPPISSDFEKNEIRFRAEMRAGFAVTRPAGFVKITIA